MVLFANSNQNVLSPNVTQTTIDKLKRKLINVVNHDWNSSIVSLVSLIQKAQDLLNDSTKLTLNELTVASKMISGTAKPYSQLRISINDVAKTVIKVDKEDKYPWKTSKLVVNYIVKIGMKNTKMNKFDQFA